jgi:ubiquinone/menaquinone biosynthesis C-methylase UbiE
MCGQEPTKRLLTTRDLGWRKPGVFNLMRCENCDLIITSPRPVPGDMPRYYEDWYSYGTVENVRREQAESESNRFIQSMRLKELEKTGPLERGMRVLDVGAGFGVQLRYFIDHRGIEATGIDFDPTTTQHSLVKGEADLRTGDLLDAGLPADHFDVVTMYETLEHVYRPKATLVEALRVLKPGGRLVVEVPDFGSPWRSVLGKYWFPVMVPVHLHHFTKASLDRVARSAGLIPERHVGVFVPFESTGSLLLAYTDITGASMYDVSRIGRAFRKPWHLPFFIFLLGWTLVVDLPVMGVLRRLGRTGAQMLIARKP